MKTLKRVATLNGCVRGAERVEGLFVVELDLSDLRRYQIKAARNKSGVSRMGPLRVSYFRPDSSTGKQITDQMDFLQLSDFVQQEIDTKAKNK